eukprot:scaffold28891_cov55-Phaeocystis_antarctica.AAC.1
MTLTLTLPLTLTRTATCTWSWTRGCYSRRAPRCHNNPSPSPSPSPSLTPTPNPNPNQAPRCSRRTTRRSRASSRRSSRSSSSSSSSGTPLFAITVAAPNTYSCIPRYIRLQAQLQADVTNVLVDRRPKRPSDSVRPSPRSKPRP